MTGQSQATAAAEHIKQAVNRLAGLVNALEELHGAIADVESNAQSAAGHLASVADIVGSTTARELSGMVQESLEEIRRTSIPNVTEVTAMCRDEIARLHTVFEKASELAQQLGA